jgi:hypothetical protein
MLGPGSTGELPGSALRPRSESALLRPCGSAGTAIENGAVALNADARRTRSSRSGRNNRSLVHRPWPGLRHHNTTHRCGRSRRRRRFSRLFRHGRRSRGGRFRNGCGRGCFGSGGWRSFWLFRGPLHWSCRDFRSSGRRRDGGLLGRRRLSGSGRRRNQNHGRLGCGGRFSRTRRRRCGHRRPYHNRSGRRS